MDFCSIASGSSGNCIYIGSEHTAVLVDSGLSGKKIEEGLRTFDRTGTDLNAILITHEHSDHVRGLGVLARKLHVPIYLTAGTKQALQESGYLGTIPEELFHVLRADEEQQIGDLTVLPFRTSHDAAEPVGYRISAGERTAAVATDMGMYTEDTIRHLMHADILLLEANHDLHMLEAGRYPYYLKLRIMGDKGHLSNEASGRLLTEILHDNMKHIVLGHLSEENNYPALAYETVCAEVTMGDCPYRSDDFPIHVADRYTVGDLLSV